MLNKNYMEHMWTPDSPPQWQNSGSKKQIQCDGICNALCCQVGSTQACFPLKRGFTKYSQLKETDLGMIYSMSNFCVSEVEKIVQVIEAFLSARTFEY